MGSKKSSPLHRLTGEINRPLFTLAAVSGLGFVVLALLVAVHHTPFFFDRPIANTIESVNFAPLDPFHSFVSALGGNVGIGIGVAVILATFIVKREATLFVAFSAVYSLIYNGVEAVIKRPRPTGLPHPTPAISGYSFPSGHVAFFVWLGVLGMVLLARRLPRPWYITGWVVVAILVIAAALSRVYVSAHWPSDVVGGLLVGVSWLALSLSLGRLTNPIFASGHKSARN